jgi:plastocyanin
MSSGMGSRRSSRKPKGFPMRALPPVLAALLVLSVPSALAATKTVDITQAGFTPKNITIDFGDTVTWTNKDTANHQVLADQVAFPTSPVLAANQSYSHTFTKSGNFDYRDAFNTNRRGSVTVRNGVTLKASAPQVAYGGSVTLSGVASSGAAGETVMLDAMECGKTTFARVASVRSVAQGAWSSPVKPTLNTVYRSNWRNATSAQLAVKVAPAISLKRLGVGRFSATVTAAQSFAGKYVVLQRYVRTRRAWKAVKRVTLRTAKAGTPPTMITSAGFRARATRGARLRLLLTQPQAGACYAPARSAAVRG